MPNCRRAIAGTRGIDVVGYDAQQVVVANLVRTTMGGQQSRLPQHTTTHCAPPSVTSITMMEPVTVMITGAAGQIGYALAPMVARGAMLGPNQPVVLHLLDIPPAATALEGVVMELVDAAYPLLKGVIASTDPSEACKGVNVRSFIHSVDWMLRPTVRVLPASLLCTHHVLDNFRYLCNLTRASVCPREVAR